jgi:hypothetical protein
MANNSQGDYGQANANPPRVENTPNASVPLLANGRSSLEQYPSPSQPSSPGLAQRNGNPEPGGPPSVHYRPPFYMEWRWELFTWALGTCAVAVIFGLLCWSKDKPLTRWHSKIQVSTIIAVLSQVAQSALIVSIAACIGQSKWVLLKDRQRIIEIQRFDEASRGPEGSLTLLALAILKLKTREFTAVQL